MSIEEAEFILTEAVIEQPSISSYTYISTEEINSAIDKILNELIIKNKEIENLKAKLTEQESELKLYQNNKIKNKYYLDKLLRKKQIINI